MKQETIRDWFPRNIKFYMVLRGIDKQTLCKRMNITRQCLNNWLRGDNPIDYIRIEQLADIFHITPAQLLTPVEVHGENCKYIGGVIA